jgi:transcriptional regulator with XRE-family HTH domain
MSSVDELHKRWMKKEGYREAYEHLEAEFTVARAVIGARVAAGLTQEKLAQPMDTTQSVIARLESGRTRPSTHTLERLAAATGTHLRISFEPAVRVYGVRADQSRIRFSYSTDVFSQYWNFARVLIDGLTAMAGWNDSEPRSPFLGD